MRNKPLAKTLNFDKLKLTYYNENINEKGGIPLTRYPLKCDKM